MDTISQSPRNKADLLHTSLQLWGLCFGRARWNWRWSIILAKGSIRASPASHLKPHHNSSFAGSQQSAMTGQGACIILNSRTLFWSSPNLHSRFLIQPDEHWVFIPTVPHGIDACVQDRLLCHPQLHSVSHVPTMWPQVVLKPASKKEEKDKLHHPFPLSGVQFSSVYKKFCIQAIKGACS